MAESKKLNERDTKLVQWLNEAHAKETELEADLTAHIALTEKRSYKKRLQQHLKETRDHKRGRRQADQAAGRVGLDRADGTGRSDALSARRPGRRSRASRGRSGPPGPWSPSKRRPICAMRRRSSREEHVEIALYSRLETLAEEVGDRETAQLARSIRRDEERMAKFLDAELRRLVKAVVMAEIPRDQRPSPARTKRSGASRRSRSTSRSRPGSAKPKSRPSRSRSR